MGWIQAFAERTLALISARRGWVLGGVLAAMLLSATAAPRAVVVGTITLFGVTCPQCDTPISETAVLGTPVNSLVGATWVAAPSDSNSLYAGGIPAGRTVNFHLAGC